VAWNGYIWVAGGSGTNSMAYSYDGISWLASATGNAVFTSSCGSVTWNGTLWIATGTGIGAVINRVAYSYDGINWAKSISGNNLLSTTANVVAARRVLPSTPLALVPTTTITNNFMIATGNTTGYLLAYSYDGQTWIGSSSASTISGAAAVLNCANSVSST
jgi:hypothetical protein